MYEKKFCSRGSLGLPPACALRRARRRQLICLTAMSSFTASFQSSGLMRARNTRDYEEYDYRTFNARTTLKLETMWHAYKGPEYQVNFYGMWKEFYDMPPNISTASTSACSEDAAHGTDKTMEEARNYNQFKDICRELYTELNGPMFQVRLGKQIVSWGETGFERMVDNINPVDLRGNLNPAYPDFAELKQGLWMGRFFFTPPDQPMDLTYELLLIPDFEPTVTGPWAITFCIRERKTA